jgi:hypothetical protein
MSSCPGCCGSSCCLSYYKPSEAAPNTTTLAHLPTLSSVMPPKLLRVSSWVSYYEPSEAALICHPAPGQSRCQRAGSSQYDMLTSVQARQLTLSSVIPPRLLRAFLLPAALGGRPGLRFGLALPAERGGSSSSSEVCACTSKRQ